MKQWDVELIKDEKYFNTHERRDAREALDNFLQQISSRNNEEVVLFDNNGNKVPLVDDQNRIEMKSFYTKAGGPHTKTEEGKIQDLHLIQQLEKDFARIDDFDQPKERMKQWHEKQHISDAELTESVVAILMHKALGADYMVLRSSKYDDYVNGVDTIIFDKYSGDIVCAFDELFDSDALISKRYEQKMKQIKHINEVEGGATIKYGITADTVSDDYIRTAVGNIPLMCIGVEQKMLYTLLRQYTKDITKKTDIEVLFLTHIIDNIRQQKQDILDKNKRHKNTDDIDKILNILEHHIN